MKSIVVEEPLLKFWVLDTVPTEDIKTTKTPEKIKILIDSTLREQLNKQHNRLHVPQCEQLMSDIHQQMMLLLNHNMSVAYFEIDDIVIIEKKYYFINDKKVINMINNNSVINKMIDNSIMFLPYELNSENDIVSLPVTLHCNSYMYSLGLLTLFCLFNISFKTHSDALTVLNQIIGIELYWCILRCLEINAQKRKLLFI
tara:strand:- start:1611 stop:2210 length:600 start_codon:yes stop_codon:yes gene_type:complete